MMFCMQVPLFDTKITPVAHQLHCA